MPCIYIIAGCNGAGKTTASYTVFPEVLHCNEFLNADNIAKGLSPFNAEGGGNRSCTNYVEQTSRIIASTN